MKNSGSCMCGKVQFCVDKDIQTIYHCFCSLCRRQSGTGFNSAAMVSEKLFEWVSNIDSIRTFKKPSGFTSCFCLFCGSPVPNRIGSSSLIWIPLGLLNEELAIKKRLGFCVNSRRNWIPAIQMDREYLELHNWKDLEDYFLD